MPSAPGDEGEAQHQQCIARIEPISDVCTTVTRPACSEDADEEFRQVANRRLDYARRRRAKVIAELVGSLADHVGDTRQRKGTREEA